LQVTRGFFASNFTYAIVSPRHVRKMNVGPPPGFVQRIAYGNITNVL
jgi:hypothetical protein